MNKAAGKAEMAENEAAPVLERLVQRDEILEVCYWFRGEGFGSLYTPGVLAPFLNCSQAAIGEALAELARRGDMETAPDAPGSYRFTAQGRRNAGRLFADSFADFQKQGHGECAAGCCDDGDHSRCGDDCILS